MMGRSSKRIARRQELLDALGPPPSWWRVFARRRWRAHYASIMSMDVSIMAEIWECHYPPDEIARIERSGRAMARMFEALKKKDRRP